MLRVNASALDYAIIKVKASGINGSGRIRRAPAT
jgi:hypothetical protein